MCRPSMPAQPDPVATANAQGAVNKETAITQAELNMIDQQGPYGSLTYERLPDQTQRAFDQDAYDAALESWRLSGSGGVAQPRFIDHSGGQTDEQGNVLQVPNPAYGQPIAPAQGPQPDRNDFYYDEAVGTPRYRAVTTLSDEQQQLADQNFDIQNQLLQTGNNQLATASDRLAQPLNLQGLPQLDASVPDSIQSAGAISRMGAPPRLDRTFADAGAIERMGVDDYGDDRQRVEDALMQRMQPYLDQNRDRRRNELVNQGFADTGAEGYRSAMDEISRAENDARLGAILNAGQEQSRLFGMELAGTGFNNQAQAQQFGQNAAEAQFSNAAATQDYGNLMAGRGFNNQAQQQQFGQNLADAQLDFAQAEHQNRARQQALQERMLMRQTPLNEIIAMMSGSQTKMPQFVNTPQTGIDPADLQGATYASYQGQLQQAQAEAQQNAAMLQGLTSLGGSALGAFGAINPFGWGA